MNGPPPFFGVWLYGMGGYNCQAWRHIEFKYLPYV